MAKNLKAGDHVITTQKGSKGPAPCSRHRRCSRARGWLGISPGTGGIHQSVRQLRPYPRPRSLLAAMADGALAGAWNAAASRDSSPLAGGRCPRMGMRTPILNASLCGALATVGRGWSGKQIRSPIAISDSAAIYFLGALGRRRCRKRTPGPPPFSSMNSTPAASKARRTAKSLAVVIDVS